MKSFKLHLLLILLPLLGISQTDVSVESILTSPFAPYSYGNNVNFQITVRNNGPLAVKNITIMDVIPCGLNFTGGSQTWNPSGQNRLTTITSILNPGESASVSISFDIMPCLLTNAWNNTAMIIAYEDISNSNIFNADTNTGNNSLSEVLPIFDLALRKTLATPSPYAYGDTLTFNIEVHNQGNQPVSGFLINDNLPVGVGYYFDPTLNPMWNGGPTVFNRWVNMNPVLNPGSVETITINLVLLRTSGGNRAWVNYAEIASVSDVSSNPIFDADSFYGSNSIQENDVLPGTLNDDNLNSTGIGNNDDDDDHDPAGAEIFDLALTKIQGSALLSFSYLQDVEYVFTIFNQGSVPATNIEITDYLSPALQYMNSPKNLLSGWNYNNMLHTAKRTYTNVLLPGQSDTLKLDLMPIQFYVDPDNAWTDFAEISDADDTDPNTALKPADIDSTPDSINGNDAGGKPNSPSDNFINGDGSGLPASPIATGDEDDHDPHKIQIFDLALRKTKVTPGSFFQIGEDVVFQITVYNQGNVPAKNILVSDYVPSGFDFIAGGPNTGWIGSEPLVKYTYAPILLPGANTSFQITLRVQNSALPNAYLNYAEVSAAMDTLNNNRNDDADSVIDDDPNNDNLAIPGSPEDDNIFGNSFIGGDQDDLDVSGIELLCQQPTLTVGIPECDPGNGTYSVTYYSNVANITNSEGTLTGSKITGINIGTNVSITASNGMNCSISMTVISPTSCPGTGGCNYPKLTVGQPLCNGSTYSVSYSTDLGAVTATTGTVNATTISNIPIGTNITVSATSGSCVSEVNVSSPTNCGVPCANSPITISGPVCETTGAGTYKINFTVDAGTNVIASTGTLSSGMVTGIPSGVDLTLTVTTPGCDTRIIVVPAGDCNLGNASVGSFVWHDINGDGQQSPGEPGIPGVHVVLYDALSNVVAQTSTGVNGQYLFTDVIPGDYFVRFNPPSNFEITFTNLGDDNLDSDAGTFNGPATTDIFTLVQGEINNSIDAGLYRCVPIGDLVWYDSNKNDVFNNTENGINGLRVNLWRNSFGAWQVWDHMYTGPKPGSPSDDGYFNFCAPPGTYFVEVIMPPLGLVRARADIGTNEEIDSDIDADGRTNHFTVSSGQSKNDLGAGFYPMAVAGNLVWRDDNLNGIQDVGEAKVQGVLVEAIKLSTGNVAATAITDSDGIYSLDYLEKQEYYLKFTPPAEYTATIPGAAPDNMDSDVDHSFGINTTRAFSMEPSNENNNMDMGIAFGVLPVEWLKIFAKKSEKGNFVSWTVGREWNVSHYIVERKATGDQQFFELTEKISVKDNKFGYSDYTFNDQDKIDSGICYYRVKQVDFDGKFSYSEIVYIKESSSLSINLYPNPAKSLTNLEILQDKDGMIEVNLLDSNGKFVKRILTEHAVKQGENLIPIQLQEIPRGLYMIRIYNGSGLVIDRKLLLTD